MRTSLKGIALIKSFESFADKPYRDIVGVNTWGYGHAQQHGEPPPLSLTESEASDLLAKDLVPRESGINAIVKVPLTQNQFDALVSFVFNLGIGSLAKSTLLLKLNAADYVGAQKEFAKWNMAGGKYVAGLARRRAAEAQLFGEAS